MRHDITWQSANQTMAEIIELLNSLGIDTNKLSASHPDDYERISQLIYRNANEEFNPRTQQWQGKN